MLLNHTIVYVGFSTPLKRRHSTINSPLSSPGIAHHSQESSDSNIAPPAFKRIKCVIVSDSEDEEPPTKPAYYKVQENIAYLSGMFMDVSDEVWSSSALYYITIF